MCPYADDVLLFLGIFLFTQFRFPSRGEIPVTFTIDIDATNIYDE